MIRINRTYAVAAHDVATLLPSKDWTITERSETNPRVRSQGGKIDLPGLSNC